MGQEDKTQSANIPCTPACTSPVCRLEALLAEPLKCRSTATSAKFCSPAASVHGSTRPTVRAHWHSPLEIKRKIRPRASKRFKQAKNMTQCAILQAMQACMCVYARSLPDRSEAEVETSARSHASSNGRRLGQLGLIIGVTC